MSKEKKQESVESQFISGIYELAPRSSGDRADLMALNLEPFGKPQSESFTVLEAFAINILLTCPFPKGVMVSARKIVYDEAGDEVCSDWLIAEDRESNLHEVYESIFISFAETLALEVKKHLSLSNENFEKLLLGSPSIQEAFQNRFGRWMSSILGRNVFGSVIGNPRFLNAEEVEPIEGDTPGKLAYLKQSVGEIARQKQAISKDNYMQ